jgi:hypothetical protein
MSTSLAKSTRTEGACDGVKQQSSRRRDIGGLGSESFPLATSPASNIGEAILHLLAEGHAPRCACKANGVRARGLQVGRDARRSPRGWKQFHRTRHDDATTQQDRHADWFLATLSDEVEGVRLEVELHRTRAHTHPALESVPNAMVILNAPDETQRASFEAAILRGDSYRGAGRSPVKMLIADRYLDRHPGLRIGFFSESQADPSGAALERSVQSQSGSADCYVHKVVEFQRCCDVVRTMRLLWLRTDQSAPSYV